MQNVRTRYREHKRVFGSSVLVLQVSYRVSHPPYGAESEDRWGNWRDAKVTDLNPLNNCTKGPYNEE